MKIATWNVNSIRTRLHHVIHWLQKNPVDALCLQETKVVDEQFPCQDFLDIGYQCAIAGQKSYNGVAILSRHPLENVRIGFAPLLDQSVADLDEQKRVITGILDGIQIVNLYVPNGSTVGSDKYAYKLRWLDVLRQYLNTLITSPPSSPSSLPPPSPSLLVCGDFNIALEDIDIHNPANREKMVMATDLEREALRAVLKLGLADVFRKFHAEGRQFSWWDYRTAAFRRNLGWRIDHIYLTPDLYDRAIACQIDITPRKLEQPSDHTPVIVELESAQ
jgi:exodeoxyribonuclease-3